VGLWRPVWFIRDEPRFDVRARLEGGEGVITIDTALPDGTIVHAGGVRTPVAAGRAELRIASPSLWWPHTHGTPHLYGVRAEGHDIVRRVGFRTLASDGDMLSDGLRPRINGKELFVRGAVWTPVADGELRSTLETARDHGLNAVRVAGTMVYETPLFHDLCDELGILVWQDLMFANFDYPFSDPDFRALVEGELDALIGLAGGRPSSFCICGGSEIEQQAAMFGLDPGLARDPFFTTRVPAALAAANVDALYLPSAPCGADRPMLASQGVSNWFGVGAYRRPLSETRAAGVRFASECLALANIGDEAPHPNDPEWKRGVPRDMGADWDFDDVRDHYLETLYDVDSGELRRSDPERWLELSRRVSGDVMAEVIGEWRRPGSGCGGAFILWLRDLLPGAGWGLLDCKGVPKPVLRALRGVLAPVAIWMTDEAMGGYAVHVANDRPEPLEGRVAIVLSRGGRRIHGGECTIDVPERSCWTGDCETIIGRWVDIGYSYRFGPPSHDLVTAELRGMDGAVTAAARRFPLGRRATQ
jgi:beta-mannosidase